MYRSRTTITTSKHWGISKYTGEEKRRFEGKQRDCIKRGRNAILCGVSAAQPSKDASPAVLGHRVIAGD